MPRDPNFENFPIDHKPGSPGFETQPLTPSPQPTPPPRQATAKEIARITKILKKGI